MGRTVTDVAVLLGVLQSPFGAVAGQPLPANYTQFLVRGALDGARIGVDRRFFDDYATYGFPGDDDTLPFFQQALDAMVALGATLVDTDTGDIFSYFGDEFTALLFEFKAYIAAYLAGSRTHTMRTLGRPDRVQSGALPGGAAALRSGTVRDLGIDERDLTDPVYLAARAAPRLAARTGIDNAIAADDLDAIVAPHLTNSTAPAVSGLPESGSADRNHGGGETGGHADVQHVPAGAAADRLRLRSRAGAERVRQQPQFLGAVNDPPDAGICPRRRRRTCSRASRTCRTAVFSFEVPDGRG